MNQLLWVMIVWLTAPLLFAQPQVEESRLYSSEQEMLRRLPPPEAKVRKEKKQEEVTESSGDEDIGVQMMLKKQEKETPFEISGSASAFYTSNAELAKEYPKSDYFWIGQAGAAYLPKITQTLLGDITIYQQFFRYDEFKNLDFDSFNVGGGLTYIAQNLWEIAFFARYNFNRLTHAHESSDGPQHSEFFKTHSITAGLQKIFQINRAQYWYVGQMSQINMADPVSSQRNDYSLFTGYNLALTRNVDVQCMYRAAYVCYANDEREDINQSVSAGVSYKPFEWATLSASGSLGLNNSNQPANNYDVVNAGLGLNLKYKF
ncbi:MAG: hypothetical protein ACOY3I_02350 [Verrucomicrobiota bacterium]